MGVIKDLTGQRFGRLVAIRQDGRDKYGRVMWLCQCDCGSAKTIRSRDLTSGRTQSCGCLNKERIIELNKRRSTHGGSYSRIYGVWSGIKVRCFDKNDPCYCNYGGRGITMCEEWKNSFEAFRDWALQNGYDNDAPKGKCTLDRIDVNGDYTPENCRFVDIKTQDRNRRTNNRITYNGQTHTLVEWSELIGIKSATLSHRIHSGWSVERALTQPLEIHAPHHIATDE